MDSDSTKRQRGDSVTATTNGRPSVPKNNDGGPIVTSKGDEHASQNASDIRLESAYVSEPHKEKVVGNPSPRSRVYLSPGRGERRLSRSSSKGASIAKGASCTRGMSNSRGLSNSRAMILEPPITQGTLSELDVNKIVHNPKLRHDINFDPDLHFRPNLDGEKGRRKAMKGNEFWHTMRRQLQEFLNNRDQFEREYGHTDWCLPATLKAIRGILRTLVPQRDHVSVDETFNVDLLMQQFQKGVADMPKLASWLSQLLKCHCAPMRDNWVDETVAQLSKGDRNFDLDMLVDGMRNLLAVLEAMKLDVANHQIRCLRPFLIQDTINFERKFFLDKIALGKVDIAGANAWYRQARSIPDVSSLVGIVKPSQEKIWDFMKALVQLILPSKSSEYLIPDTFLFFDEERLSKLRSNMLDLINLEVCVYFYHRLEASSRIAGETRPGMHATPITSAGSSPLGRPISPTIVAGALSSPTIPSAQHFSRPRSNHHAHGPYSGRPLVEPRPEDETSSSTTSSSSRSSPLSAASTPETSSLTPFFLSHPTVDGASKLRSSLIAILAFAPTKHKWSVLAPDLALQILRSTATPLTRLQHYECHLASSLSNSCSLLYENAESRVLAKLLPVLYRLVERYTPLTCAHIFEAATAPRRTPRSSAPPAGEKEDISEMATRIAHLGILHWRVWEPLAYLVDPDLDDGSMMQSEQG